MITVFFAVSVGVCDGLDEQDDLMTVGLLRTLSSLFKDETTCSLTLLTYADAWRLFRLHETCA